MPTMQFSAATPEGAVADEEVESVTVPTADGEITVLPNHIPLVSVVVPGVITARTKEAERHYAVSGGFLEVGKNGVTVLADTAERADDIDVARAEKARQRAEDLMDGKHEREEMADATATLARSLARIKAVEMVKHRRKRQG